MYTRDPHKRMALFDNMFHRIMNKMKRIEQKPRRFGTDFILYPSEIHTIEAIGRNAGINVTALAALQGVTKGAVSQTLQKLVKKGMVIRMKDEMSDREVLLKLSDTGQVAYHAHEDFHSRIDPELMEIIGQADDANIEFIEKLFKAIDRFCDQVISES
ncbi:MAG: winged helix-turn-helix transcriptional regulator [Desulfobacteraceae bacterium]|nr:winged helix-turn-helix transcriptional regulator [Desulfobacteraceae bacterium]